MDVKYKESEWEKSEKALKSLIGLGWGKGITDHLKKINKNLEDVQRDIQKDDSDGVISFSFTDKESKYQKIFEKMEVLHSYAEDAGNMVERVIDEPFYKDIDKFVEKMEGLSIDDYETKNTIGATQIISTGAYSYGMSPATTEVKKDKINLKDIMAGDNFFADNLKAQFTAYSKQNPDQKFTYDQYQSAVSSSRAFEYNSIRDDQQNTEFWRDIGIAVVIIGVSIVCPPAGLALGVAYGTLELSSATTGKDWLTGREMDCGERATRGAFALLDIIPGMKGIRAFSQATKARGLALDATQLGSKMTLKQTAKRGLSDIDTMGKQALRESAERIRKIPNVMKDVTSAAKTQLKNGTVQASKLADEMVTGVKNLNFSRARVVADPLGETHVMFNAAESTHRFEKLTKGFLNGSDEVAENLSIHVDNIKLGIDDLVTLRSKWKVPETDTVAVGKTDVKGLEGNLFEGGSPLVRKEAGLLDLDELAPNRPIQAPRKSPQFTRHAEEGVINDFIATVERSGLSPDEVAGTFAIHQSNPKGVCTACIQGIANPSVKPGIFMQLSQKYPNLVIKVTTEMQEGIKAAGKFDFILSGGKLVQ